jgi:fucose 4-O-acetylase-like acetyltransferase
MQRNKELDMAKGIGAMLVIFGHMTTYPRMIRTAIYSFHMPLFFIVTGILITIKPIKTDFITYVKHKVGTILLPAFFFELLMYIWNIIKYMLEHGFVSVAYAGKSFLGIFLQIGYSDYTGSLWFLFTFFLACVLLYPIWKCERWVSKAVVGTLLIAVSYVIAYVCPELFLPWHLEIVPCCMGYILLGHIAVVLYEKILAIHRMRGGSMSYMAGWICLLRCFFRTRLRTGLSFV